MSTVFLHCHTLILSFKIPVWATAQQGTKSCRMGRNSVRMSVRMSVRPYIRPNRQLARIAPSAARSTYFGGGKLERKTKVMRLQQLCCGNLIVFKINKHMIQDNSIVVLATFNFCNYVNNGLETLCVYFIWAYHQRFSSPLICPHRNRHICLTVIIGVQSGGDDGPSPPPHLV